MLKLTKDAKNNILDTICDDLFDVARAAKAEDYTYFPMRVLEASKKAWETLEFLVARGWITEEEKAHIWEGYENCMGEWLEDWENEDIEV